MIFPQKQKNHLSKNSNNFNSKSKGIEPKPSEVINENLSEFQPVPINESMPAQSPIVSKIEESPPSILNLVSDK